MDHKWSYKYDGCPSVVPGWGWRVLWQQRSVHLMTCVCYKRASRPWINYYIRHNIAWNLITYKSTCCENFMIFFKYGLDKDNSGLRNKLTKTLKFYLGHSTNSEIPIISYSEQQFKNAIHKNSTKNDTLLCQLYNNNKIWKTPFEYMSLTIHSNLVLSAHLMKYSCTMQLVRQ